MTDIPVPEPLARTLKQYCHINAMTADWREALLSELNYPGDPSRAPTFRAQLADAIWNATISPQQYEALTGEDFDTQDDLQDRLRELWKEIYGEAPVSGPPNS